MMFKRGGGPGRRCPRTAATRVVFLAVFGLVGWCCTGSGEAGRIREVIAEGAARAEARDLRGLLDLTAEGFRARPGDRTLEQVAETLAVAFYYYRRFRVLYPQPSVELSDDGRAANASVHFLVVREERSYPGLEELSEDPSLWLEKVGENADLYHLVLELVKTDAGWRAQAAELTTYGRPPFTP